MKAQSIDIYIAFITHQNYFTINEFFTMKAQSIPSRKLNKNYQSGELSQIIICLDYKYLNTTNI